MRYNTCRRESFKDLNKKRVFFIALMKTLTLKLRRDNDVPFDSIQNIKDSELVFGTISQVKSNFIRADVSKLW